MTMFRRHNCQIACLDANRDLLVGGAVLKEVGGVRLELSGLVFTNYSSSRMGKRLRSLSLYHSRQCCNILESRSDRRFYTAAESCKKQRGLPLPAKLVQITYYYGL